MKALALSSVVGAVIAALIIYVVDFQNPASDILIITLCVALSGSIGSAFVSLRGRRSGVKQRKA